MRREVHAPRFTPMDWPLSHKEKAEQLLRLFSKEVTASQLLLASGDEARAALEQELQEMKYREAETTARARRRSEGCDAAVQPRCAHLASNVCRGRGIVATSTTTAAAKSKADAAAPPRLSWELNLACCSCGLLCTGRPGRNHSGRA
mmetsp:Transcript_12749/g.28716  ORF Transcript_12749/g.28716 Transcript_12749/m.28716 type:complete len:147 (-) Transcript_12749:109-549(-)